MKTITYSNRTAVTFTVNNDAIILNKITAICKKHNAQDGLYNNEIGGKVLSYDRSFVIDNVGVGGTITFHEHSCDHANAANELIQLLEKECGFKNERFKEVIKTHRSEKTFHHPAGSAYKTPQCFIVPE